MEPARSPSFPERLGRYELLLPLGTGGMATVYLARHQGVGGFERDVAVKVMHAHLRNDEESKLHLLDEARLAARIRHPNVVSMLEVGEDELGLYLVMEYIEGDSLAGLLHVWPEMEDARRNRLLARILCDALAGLEAAHQLCGENGESLGLVHRDFSPHNIMVGIDGVARLTDFSIAKASDRAVRTRTGLVKGKIGYMSPEQARGLDLDRRCDVWAAGVVLWELSAGRRPFPKGDAVSTLLRIVTEPPPRLSDIVPNAPEPLVSAIAGALEMEVEHRTATAEALRLQLEAYWQSTHGIADREEVASFVGSLVGERLHDQAAQIRSVRQARRLSTPPPSQAPGSGPSDAVSTVVSAPGVPVENALPLATELPPNTESTLAAPAVKPPRPRWVGWAAIALSALALLIATRSYWQEVPAAKVAAPALPTGSAPSAKKEEAQPLIPTSVSAASSTTHELQAPSAQHPVAKIPPRPSSATRLKLAKDPY